jgi:hypothetical protein
MSTIFDEGPNLPPLPRSGGGLGRGPLGIKKAGHEPAFRFSANAPYSSADLTFST